MRKNNTRLFLSVFCSLFLIPNFIFGTEKLQSERYIEYRAIHSDKFLSFYRVFPWTVKDQKKIFIERNTAGICPLSSNVVLGQYFLEKTAEINQIIENIEVIFSLSLKSDMESKTSQKRFLTKHNDQIQIGPPENFLKGTLESKAKQQLIQLCQTPLDQQMVEGIRISAYLGKETNQPQIRIDEIYNGSLIQSTTYAPYELNCQIHESSTISSCEYKKFKHIELKYPL